MTFSPASSNSTQWTIVQHDPVTEITSCGRGQIPVINVLNLNTMSMDTVKLFISKVNGPIIVQLIVMSKGVKDKAELLFSKLKDRIIKIEMMYFNDDVSDLKWIQGLSQSIFFSFSGPGSGCEVGTIKFKARYLKHIDELQKIINTLNIQYVHLTLTTAKGYQKFFELRNLHVPAVYIDNEFIGPRDLLANGAFNVVFFNRVNKISFSRSVFFLDSDNIPDLDELHHLSSFDAQHQIFQTYVEMIDKGVIIEG